MVNLLLVTIIILEIITALLCLYLIGKKSFHFFHFSKRGFLLTILYSIVYFIVIYLVRDTYFGYESFGKFAMELSAPVFLLLSVYPIVIAFSEELLFRLYLSERFNIFVASILFTVLHYRPGFPNLMFVVLFVFAIAQCVLFKSTKSIWSVVITHLVATYSIIFIYTQI